MNVPIGQIIDLTPLKIRFTRKLGNLLVKSDPIVSLKKCSERRVGFGWGRGRGVPFSFLGCESDR